MLNITASSSEDFSAIEAALFEFDENEVFLKYFDVAVQSEADVEGITVILRNNKKFKKDLNKKKYIVSIPTTLTIDAFEFLKKYETKGNKRVPFYSVIIKGHLYQSDVKLILILCGFNDDNIRILSADEYSTGDGIIVDGGSIGGNNGSIDDDYVDGGIIGENNGNNGSNSGVNGGLIGNNNNHKCHHTNRKMHEMYHPPAPLGPPPHHHMRPEMAPPMDHHHHCKPIISCEEESFIVDTLIDQ